MTKVYDSIREIALEVENAYEDFPEDSLNFVAYTMYMNNIDYAINHYSSISVDDAEFQKLRTQYLDVSEKILNYIIANSKKL